MGSFSFPRKLPGVAKAGTEVVFDGKALILHLAV